jgi:protein-S-isoprenylcysteine O-methyltransferase Ste14
MGPYPTLRHPMYTALIITGTGLGPFSASLYFTLPFLATLIVIATRVRKEEQVMIEQSGGSYRQYCRETGRFLPRIRRD